MKQILLFLMFSLWFSVTNAQSISITGHVSGKSSAACAYVNIGISKKQTGTISNAKGDFKLSIPDSLSKDTLIFSCVGFLEKRLPIQSVTTGEKISVMLEEKVVTLTEISISNKKKKIYKLGIMGRTPFVMTPSESYNNNDIMEQARLIHTREPVKILNANIYLLNGLNDSVNVRLNFYRLENGLPGSRIWEKSIVKKFAVQKGWLSFNLDQEDIYMDKDFVVSFEYLPEENKKKARLFFGIKLGAADSYLRRGSQGAWHKNQAGGPTIYISVSA